MGIIFSLMIFEINAQIVSISSENQKNNPNKTSIFVNNLIFQSFRNVEENPFYDYSSIDQLSQEKTIFTYNFELGIVLPIARSFYIESGVGFYQNGESSSFEDISSDSTYNYTNRFGYVGIPIKLKWIPISTAYGKNKFNFGLKAGAIPQILFSYRQQRNWTTSYGSRQSEDYKIRDNLNSNNICLVFECEASYIIRNDIALNLTASYRNSLLNSFNRYGLYSRHAFGYGIGIGFSKFFK